MKKEFLMGLTAMVLAIGLALSGCESPTAGDTGGQGPNGTNALPAQTATTLDGINKFFAEGYGTVYLVGEVTLGEGQTLTIPDLHSVIVTSTGDLNGRAVAADGKGKITLAGGTIVVGGGASGSLLVYDGARLTVNSGTLTVGTGASVGIKTGAALAVTGGTITTTGAIAIEDPSAVNEALFGALKDVGATNLTVVGNTVNPQSDTAAYPTDSAGVVSALGGAAKIILYTGADDVTIGSAITNTAFNNGRVFTMTNAGADLVFNATGSLTVGDTTAGSTAGNNIVKVAGKIQVGATEATAIILDGAEIVAEEDTKVEISGATAGSIVLTNSASNGAYITVTGDSSIGAGLKIEPSAAFAKILNTANGDIVTLTGGAAGTSKITLAGGDILSLSGGKIVAYNTGSTALTTFAAGDYTSTGGADVLNSSGLVLATGGLTATGKITAATLDSFGANATAQAAAISLITGDIDVTAATVTIADTFDISSTFTGTLDVQDLIVSGSNKVFTLGATGKLKAKSLTVYPVTSSTTQNIVLNGVETNGGAGVVITSDAASSIALTGETTGPYNVLTITGGTVGDVTTANAIAFAAGTYTSALDSTTVTIGGGSGIKLDIGTTGVLKTTGAITFGGSTVVTTLAPATYTAAGSAQASISGAGVIAIGGDTLTVSNPASPTAAAIITNAASLGEATNIKKLRSVWIRLTDGLPSLTSGLDISSTGFTGKLELPATGFTLPLSQAITLDGGASIVVGDYTVAGGSITAGSGVGVSLTAADGLSIVGGSGTRNLAITGVLKYEYDDTTDGFGIGVAGTLAAGSAGNDVTFKDGVLTLGTGATLAGGTIAAGPAENRLVTLQTAALTAGTYTGSKTGLVVSADATVTLASSGGLVQADGSGVTFGFATGTYTFGGAGATVTAAKFTAGTADVKLTKNAIEGQTADAFATFAGASSAGDPVLNVTGALSLGIISVDVGTKGIITFGNSGVITLAGGAASADTDGAAISAGSSSNQAVHSGPSKTGSDNSNAAIVAGKSAAESAIAATGNTYTGKSVTISGSAQTHEDYAGIKKDGTFVTNTSTETATVVVLNN
jgi:hypothetical protein